MQDRLAKFRVGDPRVISTLVVLALSSAKASELYDLQKAIGRPLKSAIEQFPGGTTVYSTRPNRPLYEVRGWRGLSDLLFDTTPAKGDSVRPEQALITSVTVEFSESQCVGPVQAADFLRQNLGVDVITGRERYDTKQNFLEYTQVGPENRTVYFEAYQFPIHLKDGGGELRPDHAEPIKKRVARILIR